MIAPFRLWNLADMLATFGPLYTQALMILHIEEMDLYAATLDDREKTVPLKPDRLADVMNAVTMAIVMSRRLELDSALPKLQRIAASLKRPYLPREGYEDIRDLKSRMVDQLAQRKFVFLAPAQADLYDKAQLFGEKVHARFPAATPDIDSAGRCLALGFGTSTVLHLMRVMEVGLKALAKPLGVPYAPSWESYLRQINANIALPHAKKPPKWKKREAFFRDVSGDLVSVKNAWRNPTMHVVRVYEAKEAIKIFDAVHQLMERLADELPAR